MTNEELCARIQAGDDSCRKLLLEANGGFLHETAEKYRTRLSDQWKIRYTHEDLYHEAAIKLIASAKKYDSNRHTKFMTFAGTNIKNRLKDIARKESLQKEIHLSERKVSYLLELKNFRPLTSQDTETNEPSFGELIHCQDPCFIDPVGNQAIKNIRIEKLYQCILMLNERERQFVLYHYGFDEKSKCTIVDTARHFRIHESRVKAINNGVMKRMRYMMQYE